MRTKLKYVGLGLAAALLAAECALIPTEADALTSGGPPTVSSPGAEYAPVSVLYLCVNLITEQVRAEVHTDVPGNCAANEVQLPVVVASPYPTL